MTVIVGKHEVSLRPRTKLMHHLYVQVVIAILIGVMVGHFWPQAGEAMKPLGDGFIKLVKMIIAPVIFLTIVTGIAGMQELSRFGRVAGKALAYFLFFSTLALILGLIAANVVQPGAGMNIDPATLDATAVARYTKTAHESGLTDFLLQIIPETALSALTSGSILQVLFVAILFGIALSLVGPVGEPVRDLFERLGIIVFRAVQILMRVAPIGAFGAIAFTIGKYGVGSLVNLGALVATFYLTSFLFVALVLGRSFQWLFDLQTHPLPEDGVASGPGDILVRASASWPDGEDGAGRMRQVRRRSGGADRLFVQPRWHQYLHDAGRAVHRSGNQC